MCDCGGGWLPSTTGKDSCLDLNCEKPEKDRRFCFFGSASDDCDMSHDGTLNLPIATKRSVDCDRTRQPGRNRSVMRRPGSMKTRRRTKLQYRAHHQGAGHGSKSGPLVPLPLHNKGTTPQGSRCRRQVNSNTPSRCHVCSGCHGQWQQTHGLSWSSRHDGAYIATCHASLDTGHRDQINMTEAGDTQQQNHTSGGEPAARITPQGWSVSSAMAR